MISHDTPTTRPRSAGACALILWLAVFGSGCGGTEDGAPDANVTANNFADLAAAAAEVARAAYVSQEAVGGFVAPGIASDEIKYRYSGETFTVAFADGYLGESVSMSFTVSDPIPPNVANFTPVLSNFSAALTPGVNLGTGNQTWPITASSPEMQLSGSFLTNAFSTDSVGEITEWVFELTIAFGFQEIRTCNRGASIPFGGSSCPSRARDQAEHSSTNANGYIDYAPGTWSTDPICDAGTATFTVDGSIPGRYEVDYTGCVQRTADRTCTTDGVLVVQEGESVGAPFAAEGVGLQIDCTAFGVLDLDSISFECAGGPPPASLDCTLDLGSVRGNVSGLDFDVSEIAVSGPGSAVEALGRFMDPDHGGIRFEALGLDFDGCDSEVPFNGQIGGGVQPNTPPLVLALFDASCDEFTACFIETQDDLDAFGMSGVGACTSTAVVRWDDLD
jgi:hypothetical protein